MSFSGTGGKCERGVDSCGNSDACWYGVAVMIGVVPYPFWVFEDC